MTQAEKILRHIDTYGSITPVEAMSEYGIMRLASRISDLKREGVDIVAEIVTGKNRFGEDTHFARYRRA